METKPSPKQTSKQFIEQVREKMKESHEKIEDLLRRERLREARQS